MIQNESFEVLSDDALGLLSELFNKFPCPVVPCARCPFVLERPYKDSYSFAYACAFGYAHHLYRRITEAEGDQKKDDKDLHA